LNEEQNHREVRTRERLVQIFLIISGFLLAYSKEEIRPVLVLLFIMYILFILLYYIFLTRTKNDFMISFFGFLGSYVYSLFLLTFIVTQLSEAMPTYYFILLFILLTGVFTFAFLSPKHSEKLVTRFEKSSNKLESKHPKLLKAIIVILMAIMLIYALIYTIQTFME